MLCNSKLQDTIEFYVTDNEGNHIPSWLIALMKKCLYKNPMLRYSSACEMQSFLSKTLIRKL